MNRAPLEYRLMLTNTHTRPRSRRPINNSSVISYVNFAVYRLQNLMRATQGTRWANNNGTSIECRMKPSPARVCSLPSQYTHIPHTHSCVAKLYTAHRRPWNQSHKTAKVQALNAANFTIATACCSTIRRQYV